MTFVVIDITLSSSYNTFVDFYKKHWQGDCPPTIVRDFISMILCKRNLKDMFFNKICVGHRRCHEYGNLTLFHRKFSVNPTHLRLLDIIVIWKHYEHVIVNSSSYLGVESKRIDLLEDDIPISEFMGKFQN